MNIVEIYRDNNKYYCQALTEIWQYSLPVSIMCSFEVRFEKSEP